MQSKAECGWTPQRWLYCYAALPLLQIYICLLVSNRLSIYLKHLVTNTTGQWPSDIKWFSATHSFLSCRKTKERSKAGKEKKRGKKEPVIIPYNQKVQYQIIFPEAMTAKDEKSESSAKEDLSFQKQKIPWSHTLSLHLLWFLCLLTAQTPGSVDAFWAVNQLQNMISTFNAAINLIL